MSAEHAIERHALDVAEAWARGYTAGQHDLVQLPGVGSARS